MNVGGQVIGASDMIVYKHVQRDLAEIVSKGISIQLGTYGYYRQLEGKRTDKIEGANIYRGSGKIGKHHPAARSLAANRLIVLGEGATVTLDGLTIEMMPPEHPIFCCSKSPDFSLARAEGQRIIEIRIIEVVNEILKVRPDLGPALSLSVSYTKSDGDLLKGVDHLPYSPFSKPPEYKWENEYRTVFTGCPSEQSIVRLFVPDAGQFMQLMPESE